MKGESRKRKESKQKVQPLPQQFNRNRKEGKTITSFPRKESKRGEGREEKNLRLEALLAISA